MKIRIVKILDKLFEVLILLIVFLTPLYFSFYLLSNDVFELNKFILLKITIIIAVFIFLFKLIFFDKKICVPIARSRGFIIFLLYLASLIIATVFSADSGLSFFGLYSRFQGLETHLYYFILFLLFLHYLNDENKHIRINKILLSAVFSSFLVSVYGLIQMAGYDIFSWTEPALITGRVFSTLGQPNYLASFLLFTIPICAYFIYKSKGFLSRFSFIIILFSELLCLFFTYSRAGWIGLLFGSLLAIIVFIILNRGKFFKPKKSIIFAFVILIILIFSFVIALQFENNFSKRLKSSFDFREGSIAQRIYFWNASLEAIKAKPLFGHGLESQGEVFPRYYQKDWALYGNINVYPTRAHNLALDILLTRGIFGLAIFLLLVYLLFSQIIKNIVNRNNYILNYFLLFCLSSYLMSLMFGFEIIVTGVYFWLYFAIIISQNIDIHNCKQYRVVKNKLFSLIIILALFIITAILINKNFYRLVADHYFFKFRESIYTREYSLGAVYYEYLDDLKVDNYYYHANISEIIAREFSDIKDRVAQHQLSNILLKELPYLNNNRYKSIFSKAMAYSALVKNTDNNYRDKAEAEFTKLISFAPEIPVNYRKFGEFNIMNENLELAEKNFEKALSLLPDVNSPYINNKHKALVMYEKYLIYSDLGNLYKNQKQYDKAIEYYNLAYENYPQDIVTLKNVADCYYLKGDIDTAIWYNKRGMIKSPNDYTWPLAISFLYKEKGDLERYNYYTQIANNIKKKY